MSSTKSVGTRLLMTAYGFVGACATLYYGVLFLSRERRLEACERLGATDAEPRGSNRPLVWIHAASVGEVGVAAMLLAAFREQLPGCWCLLTCQTATGRTAATAKGFDDVRYFPLDTGPVWRRVLARMSPALFVCVETEIWPRLLIELASRNVPAVMVNARVTAGSFSRYRRLRSLFEPGLTTLSRVCARDPESLRRLVALGVPASRSRVCGDLKLDRVLTLAPSSERRSTPKLFDGATVFLAISTHVGEERVVLDAFAALRDENSNVRLVLAPRHPERASDVVALAREYGVVMRWGERTQESAWEILVVDTTGETGRVLPAARACFVGGSLVDVGGHNLVEPAAAGVPTANGPFLDNVRHQADLLEAAGALHVTADARELAAQWRKWLVDPAEATAAGEAARRACEREVGALERTIADLEPLIAAVKRRSRA